MTTDDVGVEDGDQARGKERRPHNVRLPGFIADHEIGLGDAIKHATRRVGIEPCGACGRRAAALNRFMVFSPRSSE